MAPLQMEEVARQRHAENVRRGELLYHLHISQGRRPIWRSAIWSRLNRIYAALGLRLEAQLGLHPWQE
jgi:hypothetical protein